MADYASADVDLWGRNGDWRRRRDAIATVIAEVAPVTGASNAEPNSDELRLLGGLLTTPAVSGLVLLDAWRYAPPGDPGFSWDRRNGYQEHTVLPDSRIDYVLVGLPEEADHGRIQTARLAGDAPVDGVWPSDHFAVTADLTG